MRRAASYRGAGALGTWRCCSGCQSEVGAGGNSRPTVPLRLRITRRRHRPMGAPKQLLSLVEELATLFERAPQLAILFANGGIRIVSRHVASSKNGRPDKAWTALPCRDHVTLSRGESLSSTGQSKMRRLPTRSRRTARVPSASYPCRTYSDCAHGAGRSRVARSRCIDRLRRRPVGLAP